MPDLRTVVCNARGPLTLADGRPITPNGVQANVDISHPENRALIDTGQLAVFEKRPVTSLPDSDLAEWIKDHTVEEVVTVAEANPPDAARLLAAEEASGSPRKTLVERLTTIQEEASQ